MEILIHKKSFSKLIKVELMTQVTENSNTTIRNSVTLLKWCVLKRIRIEGMLHWLFNFFSCLRQKTEERRAHTQMLTTEGTDTPCFMSNGNTKGQQEIPQGLRRSAKQLRINHVLNNYLQRIHLMETAIGNTKKKFIYIRSTFQRMCSKPHYFR